MKRGLILVIVAIAAIVNGGQQREAYPGQSEHREPPKGWFCSSHPNAPLDHQCACEKTCTKNDDGTVTIKEDSMPGRCKVYCHPSHCTCPIKCVPQT